MIKESPFTIHNQSYATLPLGAGLRAAAVIVRRKTAKNGASTPRKKDLVILQ